MYIKKKEKKTNKTTLVEIILKFVYELFGRYRNILLKDP